MKIEVPYNSSCHSLNLLRKRMTEGLDESRKLHKGFIFGSVIFMDLFFGYHEKCLGRAPPPPPLVIYILEYTPSDKDYQHVI